MICRNPSSCSSLPVPILVGACTEQDSELDPSPCDFQDEETLYISTIQQATQLHRGLVNFACVRPYILKNRVEADTDWERILAVDLD